MTLVQLFAEKPLVRAPIGELLGDYPDQRSHLAGSIHISIIGN